MQNDEVLEQEFESSTGIEGLLERGKKKKIQPTKEQLPKNIIFSIIVLVFYKLKFLNCL